MTAELEIKFPEGGIWEDAEFTLLVNYTIHRHSSHCKCKHAFKNEQGLYVIPYVFEALNEGGYCSTGICAECAIEAFNKFKGGTWEA